MASVDLKDAYFMVLIYTGHRMYLRFLFKNLIYLYEFTCLPFGLSSAPYCFTKLIKPVMQKLRENGIV